MKNPLILLSFFVLIFGCTPNHTFIEVETSIGPLLLTPMAENSVRVQMLGAPTHDVEELIFTEKFKSPKFAVKKDDSSIILQTSRIKVRFDKLSESLIFFDGQGRELFREKPGSRILKHSTVMGDATYETSQSYIMQPGDHQFGTGQFQDGQLDIFGLSRRLTQNNTQIVSPVIISSKGYGILWHNYGRTDFNPCETVYTVYPNENVSAKPVVAPNGRIIPQGKLYERNIEINEEGRYSILVCVGKQGIRSGHKITVDGNVILEDDNSWVPTVSTFIDFSAGTHSISVTGSAEDSVELYIRKVDNTTTFKSPVSQNLDYTVFAGSADEVISAYRTLTGPVPDMQDWAFGFIQCRERYDTQAELLEAAHGFKDRNIPMDMIVQDWQYWGETGWNSMEFDKIKYPDAKAMIDEVHDLGYKIMISVWSRVATVGSRTLNERNKHLGTTLGNDLATKGYFIPGTEWIDYFNPVAAEYYWNSFRDSLVVLGFDGWWFDATEPDNDYELLDRRVADNTIPGEVYRNVYPLVANRTMYNGFKEYYQPDKMPVVLTRSAFAGSQRYGVITWSGDIRGTWGSFERQIIGGLGQSATGLPWWTYDAGGFSRPRDQYTNPEYQELMLRFIETAVFLPFMRVHGSSSHTEPWNYSEETNRIYIDNIKLRYKIRPYILDVAKRVSKDGYTMMRPLVFDFPFDEEALKQKTEYMFGPDYLVCPITKAKVQEWTVYLPVNQNGWECFYSGEHYDGGQYVIVPVTIENIPVFKKL